MVVCRSGMVFFQNFFSPLLGKLDPGKYPDDDGYFGLTQLLYNPRFSLPGEKETLPLHWLRLGAPNELKSG